MANKRDAFAASFLLWWYDCMWSLRLPEERFTWALRLRILSQLIGAFTCVHALNFLDQCQYLRAALLRARA